MGIRGGWTARHLLTLMAMRSEASTDITRVVLFVLVIGVLLVGSFWTLLPFLNGLIWATTIAIATWPLLLRVEHLFGGRRGPAVAIMMFAILLVFMLPFAFAIAALVNAASRSPAVISDFLARGLGPAPAWIAKLPVLGARVAERWDALSAGGPPALLEAVQPYASATALWALAATGGFGRMAVLILVTVIVVGILYAKGEIAARGALALGHRLGGEAGERTLVLAGQAIRGVALGVVLTALIQSVLAGLGLYICGVPHPGLLTALAFILGVAQIGPVLVLAPSVFWLYWIGNTGWATALLVWSVPLLTLDNVVRPILIRRGVQLPMLLIIAGVIGGLISFGVVGLFVGPVILSATYTLTKDWVLRDPTLTITRASERSAS